MAPPKKDAFADLFQSASRGSSNTNLNSKLNTLSLSERQKLQETPSQLYSQPQSVNSSWSNADILTPSRQASPAAESVQPVAAQGSGSKKEVYDDPFDIFKDQNSTSKEQPKKNQLTEISLLDDDFTDFFQDSRGSSKTPAVAEDAKDDVSFSHNAAPSTSERNDRPRAKQQSPPQKTTSQSKSTEQRDLIVAELIDIGFDINQSNEAIDTVGLDLQKCVNYIMNKNSGAQTGSASNQRLEQINFNEIGNDLFKKANSFINFSKRTVMKNLEQLNGPKNNNLPEWMRNQAKYKSEAIEKKYGGEDYGTDEENINHAEIERFMRQQREREKERFSRSSSPNVPPKRSESSRTASPVPELPRRPPRTKVSTPVLPRRPRSTKEELPSSNEESNGRSSNNVAQSSPSDQATPVAAPQPQAEPSVDLLGLGSEQQETSANISTIRDSSPLNQFTQTDFATAKEKATGSFKSGDYSLALESYSLCLSLLPPTHELRVVILSNLAMVNKLLGHLRDSLTNIDEAQKLIAPEEIISAQRTISDKPIKYWSIKLLSVKAEVLELLEKYPESLELYLMLIQKFNCNDKKFMEAKRRVDKIVNPQNYSRPKSSNSSSPAPSRSATPNTPKPKVTKEEEIDPLFKDGINERIQKWAESKQNNLRAMLTNLNEIIPATVSMNDKSRNLTLNDLMLPKQVKIQYMKVISSIHPDKLASQPKELQLICTGVFIILNKAWEDFKESS